MYFVTTKRPEYCLFATTPSGRVAVGVTEDQKRVRLFLRDGKEWTTIRDWPVDEYSHTDLMLALGPVEEPAEPREILKHLPAPRALH